MAEITFAACTRRGRLALAAIGLSWAGSVGAACSDGGDPANPPPPGGVANERPIARIVLDVEVGDAPLTVRFDGSSSSDPDGQIQAYAWTFGDGGTETAAVTNHTYLVPGNYRAVLTVTDERGATGSTSDSVSVNTRAGSGTNTIQGTVWYDRDGDGARGSQEYGLEGFRLYFDENNDGLRDTAEATTVSDAQGDYAFVGVDSTRAYRIRQDLAFGWTNTSAAAAPSAPRRTTGSLPLAVNRVVGGTDATIEEFPFQVALVASSQSNPVSGHFCGGSLIAAQWVLTAAHCVDGSLPDAIDVLVGTADLGSGGERVAVQKIRTYPAYGTSQGIDNDLALLELDRPLLRRRIALHSPAETSLATPGVMATVLGWGLTQASGQGSQILQKGAAPVLSNQDCSAAYPDLTTSMICTSQVGGVDACQGDSGGPLAVPGPFGWVQVGIVSFGLRCAAFPGVYARVSTLYEYVAATVPAEPSLAVFVQWSAGQTAATVDFGNFR